MSMKIATLALAALLLPISLAAHDQGVIQVSSCEGGLCAVSCTDNRALRFEVTFDSQRENSLLIVRDPGDERLMQWKHSFNNFCNQGATNDCNSRGGEYKTPPGEACYWIIGRYKMKYPGPDPDGEWHHTTRFIIDQDRSRIRFEIGADSDFNDISVTVSQ